MGGPTAHDRQCQHAEPTGSAVHSVCQKGGPILGGEGEVGTKVGPCERKHSRYVNVINSEHTIKEQKALFTSIEVNNWFQATERGAWNRGSVTSLPGPERRGATSVPLRFSPCVPVWTPTQTQPYGDGGVSVFTEGLTPRTTVWVESRAGGTDVSAVSPSRSTLFRRDDVITCSVSRPGALQRVDTVSPALHPYSR